MFINSIWAVIRVQDNWWKNLENDSSLNWNHLCGNVWWAQDCRLISTPRNLSLLVQSLGFAVYMNRICSDWQIKENLICLRRIEKIYSIPKPVLMLHAIRCMEIERWTESYSKVRWKTIFIYIVLHTHLCNISPWWFTSI